MSRRNGEDVTNDKAPAEGKPSEGAAPAEAKGLEPVPVSLEEEIAALKREREELRDQLLRKRADFENYRKRVERDRHQAGIDAAAGLFRALIPILDNLDRALQAEAPEATLREGVQLIYKELMSLLEAQGVVVHDPTGQRFDPQTHQALAAEPVPGAEEGTVVEVFRKGYFFKDRLLRPALVKVAKGDGRDASDPEAVH
jgi:molecular chaperone GrpE